jgi:hypothetical protein
MADFEVMFRPDPKDVPEILRRQGLVIGQPFVKLPDAIPHKVLAVIDGQKVRAADIEMVFNDGLLIDFVYRGIGPTSAEQDTPAMAQLRALAADLYGQLGKDVQSKYGVVCLECGADLPEHSEACTAGAKYRRGRAVMKHGEN